MKRLPTVSVSAQKIKQVLINLMMNAIHAVGIKGYIRISTDVTETETLSIQVADDGHGIEPRHLKKIFDPFFTTKPAGEGTGLGLSVSYSIISENHNGTMDVVSEPGKGTKFIICLPV